MADFIETLIADEVAPQVLAAAVLLQNTTIDNNGVKYEEALERLHGWLEDVNTRWALKVLVERFGG